jgi:hypothetical protein
MASSASVRGDRPPSIVAMMTGHPSSVVSNRASTFVRRDQSQLVSHRAVEEELTLLTGLAGVSAYLGLTPIELARIRTLIVRIGMGAKFIRVRSHGVRASWRAMRR